MSSNLEAALGKDRGFMDMVLDTDVTDKMTGQEFLDLCDRSIEYRNDMLADLSGTHLHISQDIRDAVRDFLETENSLARCRKKFLSKRIDLLMNANELQSLSTKFNTEVLPLFRGSPDGLKTVYHKYQALIDLKVTEGQELTEDISEYADEYIDIYSRLLDLGRSLSERLREINIHFVSPYDVHRDKNLAEMRSAKETQVENRGLLEQLRPEGF